MSDYLLYLFILPLLISLSMFFSGSEAAFFSFPEVKWKTVPDKGTPLSILKQLMQYPDEVLITLLLGNEVVNILFSITMASLFMKIFEGSDLLWLKTIVSTLASLVSLLFLGEILPKTFAVKYYQQFSRVASRPFFWFFKISTPLRRLVHFVTRILNLPSYEGSTVLEEDAFISLTNQSWREGTISKEELSLIHKVFRFNDIKVKDVMRPIDEIFALPYTLSLQDMMDAVKRVPYTRIPVYRGHRQNIIGILNVKELLPFKEHLPDEEFSLTDILFEPAVVFEEEDIDEVFAKMKRDRKHFAIVKNKKEKIVGIATLEDILEEIVGEIEDEKERGKE